MLENEMLNHRLDKVESDIQILYKKVNDVTLTQVQSVTKLDSMLVTLGELKESIEALKKRPSWLWDKVIIALISALCGVVVSHIF
ncbi:MAG: hypothetical protein IJA43_00470 [Clostridia bacterium]|nr:hypothetical protein [Clostridia bacterium]